MKITKARVKNFRCVLDSEPIEVGQITCLVGKNESGKTSLLRAIERFNPLDAEKKRKFSQDFDWPRMAYADYRDDAPVLEITWLVEDGDLIALEKELGKDALKTRSFVATVKYNGSSTWGIQLDEEKVRSHLFQAAGLDSNERSALHAVDFEKIEAHIAEKGVPDSPRLQNLVATINGFRKKDPELRAIDLLAEAAPKILYFDSYDRMSGKVSVNKLREDKNNNRLSRGDTIFLNFLEHAGTGLDELGNAKNAESLFARFEGASNVITRKIFKYWRQNKHLGVKFSRNEALPEDPPPFNSGQVFHTRIENRLHGVTVNFDERSAGFTWFFSFLVQFALIKKKHGNVIILLDEPGLNLHGKAQNDLLRFITEELMPNHQVIYTTHSPFMVPPDHLDWVRTVEDVVSEDDSGNVVETKGTKVGQSVMATDADTLFPLQGALGYEITQSLFIGPNNLLVEGPGDVVYLTVASNELKRRGKIGLDSRWTLVPSGGVDKVGAFVSLFGGNKLNVAVLTDFAAGQKGKVESLRKSDILKKGHVFTAADITSTPEADIEDIWGDEVFCRIVNATYALKGKLVLKPGSLPAGTRVLKKVEDVFRADAAYPEFNHYGPAEWLMRNSAELEKTDADTSAALARFEGFFKQVNALLK